MDDTKRIVILGKTGTGKSSLANAIIGEKVFKTGHTFGSKTKECLANTRTVNGRSITLIDTPGLFDTDKPEQDLKREIVKCITECAPGPHAFLIVLKMERFTKQEQAVIIKIQEYFSQEVYKYATVVFTHGDQLDEGQTIEQIVCESKPLSDLVKKCGGRCHVIDNKYWNDKPKDEYRSNQYQVEMLLNTIDKMIAENEGSYYTNEMLQAAESLIQKVMKYMRQSLGNISEEVIRQLAKTLVSRELTIKLAGTATGVVLGALFGVGGCVVVLRCLTELEEVAGAKVAAAGEAIAAEVKALKAASESGAEAGKVVAAVGKAGVAVGKYGEVKPGTKVTAKQIAVAGGVVVARAAGGTAGRALAGVIGGAMGGVAGYQAAEGAETEWEAVKRATEAVSSGAECVVSNAQDFLNIQSGQQSKQK